MTSIFEIYIGLGSLAAQGGIHEVINLISDRHAQFQVIGLMEGFWKGIPEDTLVVQVSDEKAEVYSTGEMLKFLTQQDAIWIDDINMKFR